MSAPSPYALTYARIVSDLRRQRRDREGERYDGHNRRSHVSRMRDLAVRRRRRARREGLRALAESWT